MSRYEGCLTTDTQRSLDEVDDWIQSLPHWSGKSNEAENKVSHRRVCQLDNQVATAIVIDIGKHRPGTADNSTSQIGSPCSIMIDMAISRSETNPTPDHLYFVAFEFGKWDPDCNIRFSIDDDNVGVFIRRDGKYLINPEEFLTASLGSYLTFPYDVSDEPHNILEKQNWP